MFCKLLWSAGSKPNRQKWALHEDSL
jgi:hypothetical protein